MKKKLLAITLCTALSVSVLSGCSTASLQRTAELADKLISSEAPEAATPSPTPEVQEKTLALKKSGKVGDWKFKVTKTAAKKKIKTSAYFEAKADKGNLLVVVSASVTNQGKKKETFLPMVGMENTMMTAKLVYKDGYEYQPSSITGFNKDLTNKSIAPLTKKSGVIVFNVPKKVAKDLKSCMIRIGTKGEAVCYTAK